MPPVDPAAYWWYLANGVLAVGQLSGIAVSEVRGSRIALSRRRWQQLANDYITANYHLQYLKCITNLLRITARYDIIIPNYAGIRF
jgi:hypothetical protein